MNQYFIHIDEYATALKALYDNDDEFVNNDDFTVYFASLIVFIKSSSAMRYSVTGNRLIFFGSNYTITYTQ